MRNPHLAAKLISFFASNGDEELTYRDAMEKFDCSLGTLQNVLSHLKLDGELVVVKVIRRASGAGQPRPLRRTKGATHGNNTPI